MLKEAHLDLTADSGPPTFGIGELAETFGITSRAMRFYEDRGLLNPRRDGKTRIYNARDRARLQLILRGKRLGFSLAEIKDWLDLYDLENGQQRQYQTLLAESQNRIAELEQQLDDLRETLRELKDIEAIALQHLLSGDDESPDHKGTGFQSDISHRAAGKAVAAGQKG